MALVITYTDDTRLTINLPFRQIEMQDVAKNADSVKSIYADSQEHERVLQRLPGLPHGHGSTHWPGDLAKFIAANAYSLT